METAILPMIDLLTVNTFKVPAVNVPRTAFASGAWFGVACHFFWISSLTFPLFYRRFAILTADPKVVQRRVHN